MLAIIPPVSADEEVLSLPQAAAELGMAHVTLWRLVKAGRIASIRVGPTHGITRSELERFRKLDRPIGRPRKPRPAPPAGDGG